MNTVTGSGVPRVHVEVDCVYEIVELIDRFVHWLNGPSLMATEDCTVAMSMGQSSDPETICQWASSLAEHLEYRASISRREGDTMRALS